MHIHAIVRPEIWNQINPNVLEGGLYIIRNFQVLPPQGRLRLVRINKCILLIQTTTINAIPVDDFAIRLHKFEIAPLSILEELIESDDPEYKPRYAPGMNNFIHYNTLCTISGKQYIDVSSRRGGSSSCAITYPDYKVK